MEAKTRCLCIGEVSWFRLHNGGRLVCKRSDLYRLLFGIAEMENEGIHTV